MGRKNILVNGMHLIRSKNIEITTFLEGKNDNEQKDKRYNSHSFHLTLKIRCTS